MLRKSFGQEIVESPQIPAKDEVPEMAFSFSLGKRPTSLNQYNLQDLDNDLRELFFSAILIQSLLTPR
jgi:hypothetical protein